MSYGFADSLRAGSGGNVTVAGCTVKNSWWWAEELSETCRVLFQKQIWEISASSWFYKNLSSCKVTWTSNLNLISEPGDQINTFLYYFLLFFWLSSSSWLMFHCSPQHWVLRYSDYSMLSYEAVVRLKSVSNKSCIFWDIIKNLL